MEKAIKTTGLIYTKIPKIMSLVGVVSKDRKNTTQGSGYNFRGIDDMYNALNEHLSSENVFATSEVLDMTREERTSRAGGCLIYSIIKMKFQFYAEDGSSVSSTTIGEAMDSGDKSMNKAMSVAYKYALMQIFCIPTEEPKDSENETHEVATKPQVDNEPKQTRQVNGVTYTYAKGTSKTGKAYEGWFPPKGSNLEIFWGARFPGDKKEDALEDLEYPSEEFENAGDQR